MKAETLYEAIGEVGDDLLIECETKVAPEGAEGEKTNAKVRPAKRPFRPSRIIPVLAAAAVFVILIGVAARSMRMGSSAPAQDTAEAPAAAEAVKEEAYEAEAAAEEAPAAAEGEAAVDDAAEEPPVTEMTAEEYGLRMKVQAVSTTGICLRYRQDDTEGAGDLFIGDDYRLEELTGTAYVELPYEPAEEGSDTDEVHVIEKGKNLFWDVDWQDRYGPLAPGRYRIVKELLVRAQDGTEHTEEYSVEFRIE